MRNRSNTNYTVPYPGERPLLIDPGTAPHIFSFSWTYDLPFGRDRAFLSGDSGTRLGDRVRLDRRWRSAIPVRHRPCDHASNNLAPLGYGIKYADRVDGVDVYKDARSGLRSGSRSLPQRRGVRRAGGIRAGKHRRAPGLRAGFTQKSEALSLTRHIHARRNHRLDVGIDALNPFNFVRWNDPNTNISSGAQFGSVTGTQGARTVQINVAYSF